MPALRIGADVAQVGRHARALRADAMAAQAAALAFEGGPPARRVARLHRAAVELFMLRRYATIPVISAVSSLNASIPVPGMPFVITRTRS